MLLLHRALISVAEERSRTVLLPPKAGDVVCLSSVRLSRERPRVGDGRLGSRFQVSIGAGRWSESGRSDDVLFRRPARAVAIAVERKNPAPEVGFSLFTRAQRS